MELEQRVRRLEDRSAIDDLNTRYFLAADGDDMAGVGDSFTDDATFASSGHVAATGARAIVDFIAGARGHMGLTIHTPHYGLYTFHDDQRASGIVGAHLELVLAGQSTLGAVRYIDEYRQDDGSGSRPGHCTGVGEANTSAERARSPMKMVRMSRRAMRQTPSSCRYSSM